jgi:hypothetical protein
VDIATTLLFIFILSEKKNKFLDTSLNITIKNTKLSSAFTLITFLVGELLITKEIESPTRLENFPELDTTSFNNLKTYTMQNLNTKNEVNLSENQSVLLYLIVDTVCKCMVNETNLILEKRAMYFMEIDAEEYKQVRMSYLFYAQNFISEMNQKFEKSSLFQETRAKLIENFN